MQDYTIYTDGCYSLKHDEGAFAFVILEADTDNVVLMKKWKISGESNQRAELKAIMNGVYFCPDNCEIKVITDSQYSIGVLDTKKSGWTPKSNLDLIEQWYKMLKKKKVKVRLEWVKGHSGDHWNEVCDSMCAEALGYDPSEEYRHFKHKKNL